MSEAVELAKVARANLAAALNALQASEGVPEALFDLAEPIAKVMGILHRVERSNGAVLERDVALEEVRQLLSKLQHVGTDHPVLETVMEKVAASLSKVHSLARYVPPAAAPLPAPPPLAAFQPMAGLGSTEPLRASPFASGATAPSAVSPVLQPVPAQPAYAPPPVPMQTVPMPQVAIPQAPIPQAVQRPASAPPQPAYAPTQPNPPQPAYAPPQPAQPAYVAPAPPQPAYAPPPAAQPAYAPPPAAVSRGAAASVAKGGSVLDVSLGTHSASNFYKGLGGNDVIEHGGLFIATYKVLKIGTVIELRVMLPGDYEFTASAVVQWSREASAGEAEPGYGARFTQITAEGRQLVYRYTRNREPLFYDDL